MLLSSFSPFDKSIPGRRKWGFSIFDKGFSPRNYQTASNQNTATLSKHIANIDSKAQAFHLPEDACLAGSITPPMALFFRCRGGVMHSPEVLRPCKACQFNALYKAIAVTNRESAPLCSDYFFDHICVSI